MTTLIAVAADPGDSERYGLFNGLDHRSIYGQGYFPEPFLVDDSDLEPDEARVDWRHLEGQGERSDEVIAEVEHAFGLLTLEIETGYERENSGGTITQGLGNFELSARHPFYQHVSPDGKIDSTWGAAMEVAIPTGSDVSKNGELVPKVFNDLKLGDFTLQSIAGYSIVLGPGDGNIDNLEYGFILGYTIPRQRLALPGVQEVVPMFEVTGETALNHAPAGHTALIGDVGVRVFCKAIGRVQPRLGLGVVLPLNNNGRDETHWGLVTSLVFQY